MPGCQRAGPQPGSLVRSDMALLAMGTRRAASILDPEGQGVCEVEAWLTNRDSQKAETVWVEKQTVGSCRGPPVHPLLVGRMSWSQRG